MMILINIIVSFLLDGIISSVNNIFFPLFTLLSLVIIYPYFKNNYIKYIIYSFTVGLFYDVIYTNTPFFNAGIFLLFGILIYYFFKHFKNNNLNNLLLGIGIIILYRLFTFLILSFAGYISFSFLNLFDSIYLSLIINLVYLYIFSIINKYFLNK